MDGQEIFTWIINYLRCACLYTLGQIALVFGPAVIFALITQWLSDKIRSEGWDKFGGFYTYATAPGTVAHEFGHYFFAKLCGCKILKVCWFNPDPNGNLGYVLPSEPPGGPQVKKIKMLLIGTGPIWMCSFGIVLLAFIALGPEKLEMLGISTAQKQDFSSLAEVGRYARDVIASGCGLFGEVFSAEMLKNPLMPVCLYFILCFGAHMRMSPPDIRLSLPGIPALLLALLMFNLCTAWIGDFSMQFFYWLTQYNHVVYSLLIFTLLLMCLAWAFQLVAAIILRRGK